MVLNTLQIQGRGAVVGLQIRLLQQHTKGKFALLVYTSTCSILVSGARFSQAKPRHTNRAEKKCSPLSQRKISDPDHCSWAGLEIFNAFSCKLTFTPFFSLPPFLEKLNFTEIKEAHWEWMHVSFTLIMHSEKFPFQQTSLVFCCELDWGKKKKNTKGDFTSQLTLTKKRVCGFKNISFFTLISFPSLYDCCNDKTPPWITLRFCVGCSVLILWYRSECYFMD